MARRRVHLALSRKRVACGVSSHVRTTRVPRLVTCEECRGTLHMADAEKKAEVSRHTV